MQVFLKLLLFILIFSNFSAIAKDHESINKSEIATKFSSAKESDFTMSAKQLSSILHELTGRYISIIEVQADLISSKTSAVKYRESALQWKISSTPIIINSLYYKRPLLGLIDLWAYTIQMRDYFSSKAGEDDFGIWVTEGLVATSKLEDEIVKLARRLPKSGKIEDTRKLIEGWSGKNRISSFVDYRESIILEVYNGRNKELNAFESLGELTQQLDDIISQLTTYSTYIPKNLQWQSEALFSSLFDKDVVDTISTEMMHLAKDFHQIKALVISSPKIIKSERVETIRELKAIIESERGLVVSLIKQERETVFNSIDSLRQVIGIEAVEKSKEVIDYTLFRILQMILFIGALFLISLFFILRYMKNRI